MIKKMIRTAIIEMMIMIKMVMMKLIKMMRLEFGLVNTSNHLHVKGHKGHFRHFQKQWAGDIETAEVQPGATNIEISLFSSVQA